jgi:hypothetical protein
VAPGPEVSYNVNKNTSWLSISAGQNGITPGGLQASIDCSALTPGSYTSSITATSAGTQDAAIELSLTVIAPETGDTRVTLTQLDSTPQAVTFLLRRWTNEACTVTLQDHSPIIVPVGLRAVEFYKTGLTAGRTYSTNAVCGGDASWSGTLSTAPAVEPTSTAVPINLMPPSFIAAQNVLVEYGADASVSSGNMTVACASGCAVSIPGTRGELVFYRYKWRNAQNQVLATSKAYPVAVR